MATLIPVGMSPRIAATSTVEPDGKLGTTIMREVGQLGRHCDKRDDAHEGEKEHRELASERERRVSARPVKQHDGDAENEHPAREREPSEARDEDGGRHRENAGEDREPL